MIRDKRIIVLICLAALSCAAAVGLLAAPPAVPADTPSVFVPDKGKFRVSIDGQQVGTEEFSISPSGDAWLERSSMSARPPGGAEIKAAGQLRLAADGSPIHYDWTAQAQKKASGSVEFSGATAKCTADFGGENPLRKDFTFASPRIAVLDNNLYYQFGILARQYDWKAGGKQTFPVVIPQDMVPGTISVEAVESAPGGKETSTILRASTPDLEIMLYLDAAHRLIRLEVPSSKAVIERE
jgi:hypothetical protein